MASRFFEGSAEFKRVGAKFSFKFKIADLKMVKFTKFTSQLKRKFQLKNRYFLKKYAV